MNYIKRIATFTLSVIILISAVSVTLASEVTTENNLAYIHIHDEYCNHNGLNLINFVNNDANQLLEAAAKYFDLGYAVEIIGGTHDSSVHINIISPNRSVQSIDHADVSVDLIAFAKLFLELDAQKPAYSIMPRANLCGTPFRQVIMSVTNEFTACPRNPSICTIITPVFRVWEGCDCGWFGQRFLNIRGTPSHSWSGCR